MGVLEYSLEIFGDAGIGFVGVCRYFESLGKWEVIVECYNVGSTSLLGVFKPSSLFCLSRYIILISILISKSKFLPSFSH